MEKFKLKDIGQDSQLSSLSGFFSDLETKTGVLNFKKFLKKDEDDNLDLEQYIDFFISKDYAKELFKYYLKKDSTFQDEYNEEGVKIKNAPQSYFTKNVIDIKLQIHQFFSSSYEFKSDEQSLELGDPRLRARTFMNFLVQIEHSTNGKVKLPKPLLKEDGGLDEDQYYRGFVDPYFATDLFGDFLSWTLARREEDFEKEQSFANEITNKLGTLANNPALYVKDIYIISNLLQEKKTKYLNWRKQRTRITNKW